MEVINYLLGHKGMKIVQNTSWFNFSLDSVILANYVSIKSGQIQILDIGTGNAPIPLLLTRRTKAIIYGVEIQEEICKMANKSVQINNLDSQIKIVNADAKQISTMFDTDTFDIIVTNPPYFKVSDNSLFNKNNHKTVARHEVMINLDDILKISKRMLKNNGTFAMIHRPERMLEILVKMKSYNIEPKKICFIYPKDCAEANMLFIEGTKNGKEGLKILSPLYIYDENGEYSKRIKKMFGE